MSIPVEQSDLEARLSPADVIRFAKQNINRVEEVIAEGWAKFRGAALRVYTAASIDALTTSTLPADAKSHIVSLVVDILTSGQQRAADIQLKAEAAEKWLSRVATHNELQLDEVLTEIGSGTSNDVIRVGAPDELRMDYMDSCSKIRRADPSI